MSISARSHSTLPTVADANGLDLTSLPVLSISHAPWQTGYDPHATAQAAWIPGQGLWVRLACNEPDPFAQETEPDTSVWMDSCLECFINFRPRESGTGYLNFEVNANGAMLAGYGAERHGRVFLRSIGLNQPDVTLHKGPEGWSAAFLIGTDLIRRFYGMDELQPGDEVAANFYKCGSRTPVEHYLCWSPIEAPQPDFHRPEWFGTLTVASQP